MGRTLGGEPKEAAPPARTSAAPSGAAQAPEGPVWGCCRLAGPPGSRFGQDWGRLRRGRGAHRAGISPAPQPRPPRSRRLRTASWRELLPQNVHLRWPGCLEVSVWDERAVGSRSARLGFGRQRTSDPRNATHVRHPAQPPCRKMHPSSCQEEGGAAGKGRGRQASTPSRLQPWAFPATGPGAQPPRGMGASPARSHLRLGSAGPVVR